MCDFALNYSEKEVPDPYYGGAEGFDRVIDLLLDSCNGLLDYIVKQEKNKPLGASDRLASSECSF